MNYSRKKIGKIISGSVSGALSALVVLGAAAWFCSGAEVSSEAAEPAASGKPVVVEEDEGFVNPTLGVITSAFGFRSGRNHDGIDIGADYGTEILAADGGTVVYAAAMSGYGNFVVIDHGNGFETAYAHCERLLVHKGEDVEKGQVVATVGSTGNSTGPHLHFEVRVNGEPCDPLDYVIY